MTSPHPQPFPAAGCHGKEAFGSFSLAHEVNKARGKGRRGVRRGVYRCSVCAQWHIGLRNKQARKRRIEENEARASDRARF